MNNPRFYFLTTKIMKEGWEAIIGMEIHAQLATETKIFCRCAARFGDEPNANTCPVCLGLPGALPVLNEKVVNSARKAALAFGLNSNETSDFRPQNYFYPGLAERLSDFAIRPAVFLRRRTRDYDRRARRIRDARANSNR
jgi:hypothetical protein